MPNPKQAVFLSYAKQDADAAARICEALRAAGIEVWFDQSELRGGEVWDAAIRRQIKTCALMIPVISANTQGRAEGYFRLEWKLAVDRTHLMSQDRPFLVPVVIDHTSESDDRVPDKFREVQWTRLPRGETSAAFIAQVSRLLEHESAAEVPEAATSVGRAASASGAAVPNPPAARTRRAPMAALALVVLGSLAAVAWVSRHAWWPKPAVVAYSNEDRRMTYALLPFQAPAGDAHAAQVAKDTGDELLGVLEARKEVVTAVPRASAEQAAAHEASIGKLAAALNVHFLVRGSVARDANGYVVTVSALDGASERILTTQSLKVAPDAFTPRWRDDVRDVVGELITAGLTVEVKAARSKPDAELDVRDLSFRAIRDWRTNRDADGKAANEQANALLKRALALAPDDQYALRVTATINLCDCVNAWSANPDEQKNVGAAALEKYLLQDPESPYMLMEKAALYQLRLRWEESLVMADTVLAKEPDDANSLGIKAAALMRLGKPTESKPLVDGLLVRYPASWGAASLAADVYYSLGDYARAAQLAQTATARMSEPDLRDRVTGAVRLTLIAAEAQLGHDARAKAALADFKTMLPAVGTLTAVKKWVHPSANLADFEPLYAGLRRAGLGA